MLRVMGWVVLFYQYRGKNSRGKTLDPPYSGEPPQPHHPLKSVWERLGYSASTRITGCKAQLLGLDFRGKVVPATS